MVPLASDFSAQISTRQVRVLIICETKFPLLILSKLRICVLPLNPMQAIVTCGWLRMPGAIQLWQ